MILQSIQMVQGWCTSSLFSFLWHNIRKISIGNWLIVYIGVSPLPPLQKYHPHFSCQVPLKLSNCPSPPPLFSNRPCILVFCEPPLPHPLKVGSFSELPKYRSFSSLIPSYLLKITKFFSKISQFEFLVMTEKNIFCL